VPDATQRSAKPSLPDLVGNELQKCFSGLTLFTLAALKRSVHDESVRSRYLPLLFVICHRFGFERFSLAHPLSAFFSVAESVH
jgi:hypothetical protein